MIAFTTPTIPLTINTDLLVSNRCDVYGTFARGNRSVTIQPFNMEVDSTNHKTTLYFKLTQEQTAYLGGSEALAQVNFIDWMGYRAATKEVPVYIGTNLLDKELTNGR